MRRFTKRNHRGRRQDWDDAAPAVVEPGAVVNVVSDSPAIPPVQSVTGPDWCGDIYRLGRNIGAAASTNTTRGRWFRFTRPQATITATALVYVLLCAALVCVRAAVHFWNVVK